jgi:DNA-binding PadR family transcriptional regulator
MPQPANAPLTPAVLHILLALADKVRHGYAIMKQVQADSDGRVKMGPGTLYGALSRMTKSGLIDESEGRSNPDLDDERRIYYRLTDAGRDALSLEISRYRSVVEVAKARSPARIFSPAHSTLSGSGA